MGCCFLWVLLSQENPWRLNQKIDFCSFFVFFVFFFFVFCLVTFIVCLLRLNGTEVWFSKAAGINSNISKDDHLISIQ